MNCIDWDFKAWKAVKIKTVYERVNEELYG